MDFRKPSSEPVRQSQAERQIILRGGTSWKQELCEVIDYAKRNSADMEEFQNILAQYGIEITRNSFGEFYMQIEEKYRKDYSV